MFLVSCRHEPVNVILNDILPSAVNHLATAYELVHYFDIAEPTAVATSPGNLAKVLQALDLAPKSFPKPQIIILEDGTPESSSAGLKFVSLCPVTLTSHTFY